MADIETQVQNNTKQVEKSIVTTCYFSVVLCIAASVITILALALPSYLKGEERIFFISILSVVFVTCLISLFLARKSPKILPVFTTLTAFVSGLGIGLVIGKA
jgi:predicted membrane channel-forming protein YqfA (hemolysin III family)